MTALPVNSTPCAGPEAVLYTVAWTDAKLSSAAKKEGGAGGFRTPQL